MATAREIVTRRVSTRAREYPDFRLVALDAGGLAARDEALAIAIDRAVARRWRTLAAVVVHHVDRPWERVQPELRGVLLVGAAQLLLMDRLPDHAVIHEAVDLARLLARPKAGGFVNAVLRRVADARLDVVPAHDPDRRDELPRSDGGALRLRGDVFAEDPARRLAETTSHADELLEAWRSTFGDDTTRFLARHDLVEAPVIVAGLDGEVPGTVAHDTPGFRVLEDHGRLEAILAEHPDARVQDPGSARTIAATGHLRPSLIVDACAGKGTKTRQLRRLHPSATIVATDVDPDRRAALRAAVAGDPAIEVPEPDALAPWEGRADLLVLDVPCSNTGVLARRLEAKYRFGRRTLRSLVERQRSIVKQTLPLLAPGGHLLYATCSLESAENEAQAAWMTKRPGLMLVDGERTMPAGLPGEPSARYADGGYYALLRPKETTITREG